MHYRKEENGDLVISAATPEEQAVIDALIAAIVAYKATLAEDNASQEERPQIPEGHDGKSMAMPIARTY